MIAAKKQAGNLEGRNSQHHQKKKKCPGQRCGRVLTQQTMWRRGHYHRTGERGRKKNEEIAEIVVLNKGLQRAVIARFGSRRSAGVTLFFTSSEENAGQVYMWKFEYVLVWLLIYQSSMWIVYMGNFPGNYVVADREIHFSPLANRKVYL